VVPRLAAWLQPQAGASALQIDRVKASGVKLGLREGELPSFDATVDLGADGSLRKAVLRDPKLTVELAPVKGEGLRANFKARSWTPPVGLAIEFAEIAGEGLVTPGQIAVSNIDGRLYNGALKGQVTVKWAGEIGAEGDFTLQGADLAQVLSGFGSAFDATGSLQTSGKFTSRGQKVAELFSSARITAEFTVQKGMLNNIDLVRALQSASGGPQRGGKTQFNELTGDAQVAGERIAYRNLKLSSGPMNAAGAVDISPSDGLSGRINVHLGSKNVTVARGTLSVSGSLKDPQLRQ